MRRGAQRRRILGLCAVLAILHAGTTLGSARQRRPPPASTTILCQSLVADRKVVDAGEQVALTATAEDADGDALSYRWTATGGRIAGSGPTATFFTEGLKGLQTLTVLANDGYGHAVECSTSVLVIPRPTWHPQVFFVKESASVYHGAVVSLLAREVAPTAPAGPYRYRWTASAGTITPSAVNHLLADLDTTGAVGAVGVELAVHDAAGVCVNRIATIVRVWQAQLAPIDQLLITFARRSARLDATAVETLVFAADRMRLPAEKRLVIDGHSTNDESPDIAVSRAKAARDHLVNLAGVDPRIISVRAFAGRCPLAKKSKSRRVVVYTIPRDLPIEVFDIGCRAEPLGP
jgi:hypothetical protein